MADQAQNEMLMKAFKEAGISAGSLDINVQDGVATISGDVENSVAKEQILEVAKNTSGITEVINLTTTN